ncbi:hypothetical protein DFJ73DRAFT_849404 [Zopfochytrium polystomum]|nr:hypothetical protein DFJ73DRAFT_849404 [Zopfochytrium polystomum]
MPSPDDDDHDDEFGGTTSSAAADAPDNVGSIALFPATPRPGPHSGRAVSSQPHPALHLRFAGNRRPDKIVRLEENPRDDVPDQEVLFARSMLVTNRKKLYVSSYYGAESEDGRLLAIVGWGWSSDGVTYNSRNRLNSIGSECKFCHGQNNCWGFQCPSAGRMLRRR